MRGASSLLKCQWEHDSRELSTLCSHATVEHLVSMTSRFPSKNFSKKNCGPGLFSKKNYSTELRITKSTIVSPPSALQKCHDAMLRALQTKVPGLTFSQLYQIGRSQLPDSLKERFPVSAGFVTGLEFKDTQCLISEKNTRPIASGMVLALQSGIAPPAAAAAGAPAPPKNNWALAICDTVAVKGKNETAVVYTIGAKREAAEVVYEFVSEAALPVVPPRQPPAQQQLPPHNKMVGKGGKGLSGAGDLSKTAAGPAAQLAAKGGKGALQHGGGKTGQAVPQNDPRLAAQAAAAAEYLQRLKANGGTQLKGT